MFELFKNDDDCNFFHQIILQSKNIVNGDELVKMFNGVLESQMIGQILYDHALDLGFDIDRDFFVTHSAAILAAMQNAGCLPAYITLIKYLLGEETEITFEEPANGHLIVNIKEKVVSEDGLGGITIGGSGELVTTSPNPPPDYKWVVNYKANESWAKFPPVAIPCRGYSKSDSKARHKPIGDSRYTVPNWVIQNEDEISFFIKGESLQDGRWHYLIDEPASGAGGGERPYLAIDSAGKLALFDDNFKVYVNGSVVTNGDQFTIWNELYHIRVVAKSAAVGKVISNIRQSRDSAEFFTGELYCLSFTRASGESGNRFYYAWNDGGAPVDPTALIDSRGGQHGSVVGAWGKGYEAGKMKFKFNSSNNLASGVEAAFYLTSFIFSNFQNADKFYQQGYLGGNDCQAGIYLDSRDASQPLGTAKIVFNHQLISSLKINGQEVAGLLNTDSARFVSDNAIYQVELEAGCYDLICRDMGIGHYNGAVASEGFTGEIYDLEFSSTFEDGHGGEVKFFDSIVSDAEPQERVLPVSGANRSDMFFNNDAKEGAITGWYKRAATWMSTNPAWKGVKIAGNGVPWFGCGRPMWDGLHSGSSAKIRIGKCSGTSVDSQAVFSIIVRGVQSGKNWLVDSRQLIDGFAGYVEFDFNGLGIDEPCYLMIERRHSNPPDGELIIESMTMNGETSGTLEGLNSPWVKSKVQEDEIESFVADPLIDKGVLLQKVESSRSLIETKKILEMIKPKGIFTEFNFVK